MTIWPYQEAGADQSQSVEPSITRRVTPNVGMSLIMKKRDPRVAIHDDVRYSAMPEGPPFVFVVGDEVSARKSLELQICNAGWRTETFPSALELLYHERSLVPSCLVLSIAFPGPDVLDLQNRLTTDRKDMPIILVTGDADVATTVRAMKAGAFDFFTKPFHEGALLSAIGRAIEYSRTALARELEISRLRSCYASLSSREREVMALVVSGLLNKLIGAELGISEITVKAHRGRVMRKMKADSLASLIRMAATLRAQDAQGTRMPYGLSKSVLRTLPVLTSVPQDCAIVGEESRV